MKYKKKPVIVDAIQWQGYVDEFDDGPECEAPEWILEAFQKGLIQMTYPTMLIVTLEGIVTAKAGDYIIKGVEGELYPCRADIFKKTYEEARDE